MQLRNSAGVLATPIEERAILIAFVQNTWKGTPLHRVPSANAPGVPLELSDLVAALSQIPATKAVALPYAPGLV